MIDARQTAAANAQQAQADTQQQQMDDQQKQIDATQKRFPHLAMPRPTHIIKRWLTPD